MDLDALCVFNLQGAGCKVYFSRAYLSWTTARDLLQTRLFQVMSHSLSLYQPPIVICGNHSQQPAFPRHPCRFHGSNMLPAHEMTGLGGLQDGVPGVVGKLAWRWCRGVNDLWHWKWNSPLQISYMSFVSENRGDTTKASIKRIDWTGHVAVDRFGTSSSNGPRALWGGVARVLEEMIRAYVGVQPSTYSRHVRKSTVYPSKNRWEYRPCFDHGTYHPNDTGLRGHWPCLSSLPTKSILGVLWRFW
jgi:hypothetical protein